MLVPKVNTNGNKRTCVQRRQKMKEKENGQKVWMHTIGPKQTKWNSIQQSKNTSVKPFLQKQQIKH